ncbi:hypothetical protein EUGRSUZ_C02221 [Eucalyptus grandis]|uniref:PHD-type domain-containing protein n=4 Tax=Eucalyptus grandis TaxID=71139 RepID=A0A059CQW7_EUCGR|nr:hypothetical protein EUGRSUZ_C02221 [Eucalyptus grandis]KAK3437562.1 hypothetical protein EUGRSUZ_C02221 [Eucalyptus grandis]KAK3437563.1 hypothetical protein EUGRSUZ_C02221 [Eucalyptus grandis]
MCGANVVPETQEMCPKCEEDSGSGCCKTIPAVENRRHADGYSSSILRDNFLSNLSTFSRNSFDHVYKRRKLRQDSDSIVNEQMDMKRRGNIPSANCSIGPSITEKEPSLGCLSKHEIVAAGESVPSLVVDSHTHISDSEPFHKYKALEERGPDGASIGRMRKVIDVGSANDSCSSKSNTELTSTSLRAGVDETFECSSSSVTRMEGRSDVPLRENDICISILRSQGLLERTCSTPTLASEDTMSHSSDCSDACSCKSCGHNGTALKMLICDHCDGAFHLSCCYPRIKKVPENDWFCPSCLRKKHIVKKQKATKKPTKTIIATAKGKSASAVDNSNPIASMLEDDEPYTTSVRVGKGFQADVPEWRGPQKDDTNMVEEPAAIDPSEYAHLQYLKSSKPSRLSSIGNWLQCRKAVDNAGVNGNICGKWRRAPLFEVQTDKWECFCSVFWDPSHSDCAVHQELETDQVLKQLKYIEMLRPQLAASRRKLVLSKSEVSQEPLGNATNI